MPPTPSSWWAGRSMRAGKNPPTLTPTVSIRYLPTRPLEFARPFGKRLDREFRSSRADSHALAQRTTILAFACTSCRVLRSTYETPVALPSPSVSTSRHIASVRISRFPVLSAGGSSTVGDEKLEPVAHERPHWPQ